MSFFFFLYLTQNRANPIMANRKYSHHPQEFQFIEPKRFNFNKISNFSRKCQALKRYFLSFSWDTRYNDILFRFIKCVGEMFRFLDNAEWAAFYHYYTMGNKMKL